MEEKKKQKLIPPDKEACQVYKYNPFILGGSCYYQCGKTPTYIVAEKEPGADGLRGSQSCCQSCKEEWEEREGKEGVHENFEWRDIKKPKKARTA